MDILDDMGVSKLSAKVFFKVNYSFNDSIEYRKQSLPHQNGEWSVSGPSDAETSPL